VSDESKNGNGGDEWSDTKTPTGYATIARVAKKALHDQFESLRVAAINGLALADALEGLSEPSLRACLESLEKQCRDAGHLCHTTARALHDLLMERKPKEE